MVLKASFRENISPSNIALKNDVYENIPTIGDQCFESIHKKSEMIVLEVLS